LHPESPTGSQLSPIPKKITKLAQSTYLDSLTKASHLKESPKDFVRMSSEILRSNIRIKDTTEEKEKLKEYIIMEN